MGSTKNNLKENFMLRSLMITALIFSSALFGSPSEEPVATESQVLTEKDAINDFLKQFLAEKLKDEEKAVLFLAKQNEFQEKLMESEKLRQEFLAAIENETIVDFYHTHVPDVESVFRELYLANDQSQDCDFEHFLSNMFSEVKRTIEQLDLQTLAQDPEYTAEMTTLLKKYQEDKDSTAYMEGASEALTKYRSK